MNKLKISSILILSALLFSCGNNQNTSGLDPNHEHSFTIKNIEEIHLAKAADCYNPATYYYSCSCGLNGDKTFTNGDALGHSFTHYISNNDATCQYNGTKTAKCDRCDETRTITDHGSQKAHVYDVQNVNDKYLVSRGDCEHKAVYFYSCECGEVGEETFEYGELKEHEWTNPSLFEIDKVKFKCKNCDSTKIDDRYKTLDIYATNDYHGAVNGSAPLLKFGSYFKQKSELPNTLLIDSGDTWKGPYESNINYGKMVNEVMNYCHFDSRTVGNHDFDWGLENLKANTAASYDGYSTPVLAANVYDYDFETKTPGNIQQSDIGREYVTYTLENGLKVGIVGIIPDDQIQTICSNLVSTICFKDYVNIAKNLCEKLRKDEKCDIVVLSTHEGVAEMTRNASVLTTTCASTGRPYCDVMLCSHTHNYETSELNGILLEQNSATGTNFRLVNMAYDCYLGKVTEWDETTIFGSSIGNGLEIDPNVQAIIDKYSNQINEKKNLVAHPNVVTNFNKTEMTNLLAKSIFEEAKKQGYDISYSYVFQAYSDVSSGVWKFPDVYESIRFDNIPYIIKVKGSQLLNAFTYTPETDIVKLSMYRGTNSDATAAVDPNKTYQIVCLDKIAFHCSYKNGVRNYDYFPGAEVVDYLKNDGKIYFYRDLLVDYLIANSNAPLSNSNYTGSHYDSSLLSSAI